MTLAEEIAALFRRDLARLLEELAAFPGEQVLWRILPGIANSAGHLMLHLEGNLREYIGRQLGGLEYTRNRPLEFNSEPVLSEDLRTRIEWLRDHIPAAIASLPDAVLEADYPERMWSSPMTSRQFLIHLHGHFNYHLGQIDYLRRGLTGDGSVPFVQF
jgi:uncharacterized damage-inducible protein DinB